MFLGDTSYKPLKSSITSKIMQDSVGCPICRLLLKTIYLTKGAESLDPERAIILIESEVKITTPVVATLWFESRALMIYRNLDDMS